jgi:hypothetical protein
MRFPSNEVLKMKNSVFRSQLSFFPSANKSDGLNIVSGVKAVADSILLILLLQKGELPLHPDAGMSPQFFTSPSSVDAFRDEAQKVLETWNKKGNLGFEQVWVETATIDGRISLKVTFTVDYSDDSHVLTFGYWELINFIAQKNIQGLMDTIQLS